MELQWLMFVLLLMFAVLFPFTVWLAIRARVRRAEVSARLSDLHLLIDRTTQLNQEVVSAAMRAGRPVVMGPRERQYRDLGEF
jgi:hypothetical protein